MIDQGKSQYIDPRGGPFCRRPFQYKKNEIASIIKNIPASQKQALLKETHALISSFIGRSLGTPGNIKRSSPKKELTELTNHLSRIEKTLKHLSLPSRAELTRNLRKCTLTPLQQIDRDIFYLKLSSIQSCNSLNHLSRGNREPHYYSVITCLYDVWFKYTKKKPGRTSKAKKNDIKTVAKSKLLEINSIKDSLLDPDHPSSVWSPSNSSTDLELAEYPTKSEVKKIAGNDFERIWAILQQAHTPDEEIQIDCGDFFDYLNAAIQPAEKIIYKELGGNINKETLDKLNLDSEFIFENLIRNEWAREITPTELKLTINFSKNKNRASALFTKETMTILKKSTPFPSIPGVARKVLDQTPMGNSSIK
jgi:hypothetical protein